ncbi:hypothetical protein [Clostridium sp. KNHs214]|uniref:hypothetical protein n=1 Tax=Clostridium sp. KNHs214 TaxID=1540257 RepID=UPI000557AA2D|nr:hypothetical protein [Clostridium sp. KNHs214]
MEKLDYSNITPLYWTKDTRIGKVLINTEPTPLRVKSENLPRRRQLWVVNDSATYIYHSTDPNFTLESGKYIFNVPAEVIVYDLNPDENLTIYARTKEYPVTIRVFEVI